MALDFVGVAKRDAAGARVHKVSVRFVECGGRPKVCVLADIHIKDSDVVEAAVRAEKPKSSVPPLVQPVMELSALVVTLLVAPVKVRNVSNSLPLGKCQPSGQTPRTAPLGLQVALYPQPFPVVENLAAESMAALHR